MLNLTLLSKAIVNRKYKTVSLNSKGKVLVQITKIMHFRTFSTDRAMDVWPMLYFLLKQLYMTRLENVVQKVEYKHHERQKRIKNPIYRMHQ